MLELHNSLQSLFVKEGNDTFQHFSNTITKTYSLNVAKTTSSLN